MRQKVNSLLAIGLAVAVLLVMAAPVAVEAATAKKDTTKSSEENKGGLTGTVTQSYNADGSVLPGMLVKLKEKDSTFVEPVDVKNEKAMFGIVVPTNDAPIVLTPQNIKEQQVLVATSGRYSALVNTQNGPIKVGDYLAVSALNGVAMKADEKQVQVLGKAASAFSGTSDVISSIKLKDTLGHEKSVAIGRISVDMNISHNPLYSKTVDYVPGFIASVAINIADKPVSIARIYLCTLILMITFLVTAVMLFSGIRSGMISVGRNPLSKKSIIKSLIQTVIAGLIIFVAGVFAVYLLLKL